jgi:hypothetical protein
VRVFYTEDKLLISLLFRSTRKIFGCVANSDLNPIPYSTLTLSRRTEDSSVDVGS